MLEHKGSVLSVHHKFNKPYLPVSQAKSRLSLLHDQSKEKASYTELLQCAVSLKATYKVRDEEITTLEESIRLQSKCGLWSIHQAGRVTASNFKAAVHTNSDRPSLSLVKKLCYFEAHRFASVATSWGCQQESHAIEEFLDSFAVGHQDPSFQQSGLVVNRKYPFLGASPDGVP